MHSSVTCTKAAAHGHDVHWPCSQNIWLPQLVLSGSVVNVHAPVPESHIPLVWHASEGVQVTGGVVCVQLPPWQVLTPLHLLPSSQSVPRPCQRTDWSPEPPLASARRSSPHAHLAALAADRAAQARVGAVVTRRAAVEARAARMDLGMLAGLRCDRPCRLRRLRNDRPANAIPHAVSRRPPQSADVLQSNVSRTAGT